MSPGGWDRGLFWDAEAEDGWDAFAGWDARPGWDVDPFWDVK